MFKAIYFLILLQLSFCTIVSKKNVVRERILPFKALKDMFWGVIDKFKYSSDWRTQDEYQRKITNIKLKKNKSPINNVLVNFNNIFKRDMVNRCIISIYKAFENNQSKEFLIFKKDLLEMCNDFGKYIRENVNLSANFYEPKSAIFFYEVNLKQKLNEMNEQDNYNVFWKTKGMYNFFIWALKDDIQKVSKNEDMNDRKFLNYNGISQMYKTFLDVFFETLFDHNMNPIKAKDLISA
jgi:hypothetical protein